MGTSPRTQPVAAAPEPPPPVKVIVGLTIGPEEAVPPRDGNLGYAQYRSCRCPYAALEFRRAECDCRQCVVAGALCQYNDAGECSRGSQYRLRVGAGPKAVSGGYGNGGRILVAGAGIGNGKADYSEQSRAVSAGDAAAGDADAGR